MNVRKTSNVTLKEIRVFLEKIGAKHKRDRGGHEIWFHKNLQRSIPIQSHIDSVPEFIVLEILRHFKMSKQEMWKLINKDKGTTKRKVKVAKKGKRSLKNKSK